MASERAGGITTVYTRRHRRHATADVRLGGRRYPCREVPARAELILAAVRAGRLGPVRAPRDHGLAPILAVHDADYVAYLRSAYARSAAHFGEAGPVLVGEGVRQHRPAARPVDFPALRLYYTFDYEDPILEGTWEAAYWSAQCALTAAELVRAGLGVAYALCRPPGHHATAGQYGGFCYLNNAAVAARALAAHGPVAVLDLDYHHGNGTQAIFYADPQVFYASLHADPDVDYPFHWGRAAERGAGLGRGCTRNWPLPPGTGDPAYLAALDAALAAIVAFAPRFLLVSLGLDLVAGDPIGKFAVTLAGLREVGWRVAGLRLPTVVVQEGGYNLATLGESAVTFLRAFFLERPG